MSIHFQRSSWRYSRFDGTQTAPLIDADDVMASLTDDLLYHGDPDAALRRLLTSGFRRPDGEQVQGLRELMERLRQRRQEELESGELGGAFHEIAQELDDVVNEERAGLESLSEDARQSGDERRQEVTNDVVARFARMRSLLIMIGADSTSRRCRPMLKSPSLR